MAIHSHVWRYTVMRTPIQRSSWKMWRASLNGYLYPVSSHYLSSSVNMRLLNKLSPSEPLQQLSIVNRKQLKRQTIVAGMIVSLIICSILIDITQYVFPGNISDSEPKTAVPLFVFSIDIRFSFSDNAKNNCGMSSRAMIILTKKPHHRIA
jgi:hypothetical protein